MINQITKKTLIFLSVLSSLNLYAINNEDKKLLKTIRCMGVSVDRFQSLDDFIASYGYDLGQDLYEAQENLTKNELIICVREYKNKCAVSSLDSLIDEKKADITVSSILNSVRECTNKKTSS